MPIFRIATPPPPRRLPGTALRRAPSAGFPARIMPGGTRKGAQPIGPMTAAQHFNNSMAAQAARNPRLANIQAAALAIRTGGGLRGKARGR